MNHGHRKVQPSLVAAAAAAAAAILCAAPEAYAAAGATPATTLAKLKAAHPGTSFTAVNRTPLPGLFEVVMGENIAYVSGGDTRYLLFGRLFDTREGRDLTGARLAAAGATGLSASPAPSFRLADMPLGDALTTVAGSGARTLVLFSDPHCGYCRRLDSQIKKLRDVTIHTFIVPYQGMALGQAIWCSRDKHAAWARVMEGEDVASASTVPCPHPLERNLKLASKLKQGGAPWMYFADGTSMQGYTDAADIEARLNISSKQVQP